MKTDISDFYGSIYTHALDWALHGRESAKANIRSRGQELPGAEFDRLVRNGQDGQTKGIPIGPDTSKVAAEVLLCHLDVELAKESPNASFAAFRLSDDLEFFAQTRGEAEHLLLAWDGLLAQYDLNLNHKKTQIIEGPIPPETEWKVALSQIRLRNTSDSKMANDIRILFSAAFELRRRFPDGGVLSYAISTCTNSLRMGPIAWAEFFQLLLASAIAEPSSLKYVAEALRAAVNRRHEISRIQLGEAIDGLLQFHAPLEHGSEVAWSLSILRDMKMRLSSETAALIAKMRDNCSLILLADFVSALRIVGPGPDLSNAVSRAEEDFAWRGPDWLLAYEYARNGWASDKHFKAQAHWNELLQRNVGFYQRLRLGGLPRAVSPDSPKTGSKGTEGTTPATPSVQTASVEELLTEQASVTEDAEIYSPDIDSDVQILFEQFADIDDYAFDEEYTGSGEPGRIAPQREDRPEPSDGVDPRAPQDPWD